MISSDLRELYQEVILDHSKHPRNFRVLKDANHTAEGFNPLCGDRLKLYLAIDSDQIKDISFQGSGCAISKASASMMTDSIKGKSTKEAETIFQEFHRMLSGKHSPSPSPLPEGEGKAAEGEPRPGRGEGSSKLGKLSVFSGVSEFPVRVKCATLAWHTLKAGMETNGKVVSTEEESNAG